MSRTNRAYRLRRRPAGKVTDADLEFVTEPVGELGDGQALVQTLVLSLDPTNRIWMSDHRGYMPPVPLDSVMRGLGVGRVIESRRADLPVGAHVLGWTGWQELTVADDSALISPFTVLPDPLPAPPSAFVGVLGHTGITAWLGLEILALAPGETVVISGAAGAVGSIATQLAKSQQARVVGVAGGPEKCAHVVEDLGADACVDHRAEDWHDQLVAATPNGIDGDFENVGGPLMDAILDRLNIGARVALCGMIADYNQFGDGSEPIGQRAVGQLLMTRSTLQGFLVLDYAERFAEIVEQLAGRWATGKLRAEETVVDGLENAREALDQLFTGGNRGKLVVRVSG
ncbi:MAG TPA: NADP-dependent oxidoreductase [Solirubrobacteraceae bacterium]|jgi:NADPH2:quinone reductase|nr:NADP-dependent oxidoreductase [Solirubrobacteraceae bacterium]